MLRIKSALLPALCILGIGCAMPSQAETVIVHAKGTTKPAPKPAPKPQTSDDPIIVIAVIDITITEPKK